MSISLRNGGGQFPRLPLWNIIMYKNGKVDSLKGSPLPKIRIIWENASNKSCWALNFIQKSQWEHMSTFPMSRVREIKRCPSLKYYNVQKRKSRFNLGLDAAKNTHYVWKCFKKSCWTLNSIQKSQWVHLFISRRNGVRGLQRLLSLKYYNVQKWESRFTLGHDGANNMHYIQKIFI